MRICEQSYHVTRENKGTFRFSQPWKLMTAANIYVYVYKF